MNTPTEAVTPPALSGITADEQIILDLVNKERSAAGLQPLKMDLRLIAVARDKAADMKANHY
ncbi:MAG: CAP domain-containing protein, partial [Peptococcaceae bacterium]|nr:CAP domain-containing protein [Peptococcaceae bacterium]